MMRFCAVSSRSERQCAAANLEVLNVPFRCTRMTSSHSCSDMLKIIRSRRMPGDVDQHVEPAELGDRALDQALGRRVIGDVGAVGDRLAAGAGDLVDDLAAPASASRARAVDAAPRSLTTTLAPSRASSRAVDLPMPRPAPVTIATRPSRLPMQLTRPFMIVRCPILERSSGIITETRVTWCSSWLAPASTGTRGRAWHDAANGAAVGDEAVMTPMAEPQARKPGSSSWQWGRTAQTQRALLDAARDVFARQGFAEASIADVVERAGLERGQPVPPLRRQERAVPRALARAPAGLRGGRERGGRGGAAAGRDRPGRAVRGRGARVPRGQLAAARPGHAVLDRGRAAGVRGDEAAPRARVDPAERRAAAAARTPRWTACTRPC